MKFPLLLTLAALSAWPVAVRAQTLVRKVNGLTGELFGGAVIRAGDQNGDGFEDLLVGAPGANGGRGAIYCVSGGYLALGSGSQLVWSFVPPGLSASSHFGAALVMGGDIVGNSAPDIVVGVPGPFGNPGFIVVVDGSTHMSVLAKSSGPIGGSPQNCGQSLANMGDLDGDGKAEIAVGIPNGNNAGVVAVVAGSSMMNNNPLTSSSLYSSNSGAGYGTSLAAADVNGDGDLDLVIGSPLDASGAGFIHVLDRQGPTMFGAVHVGSVAGAHLGQSVDAANDYDGDGMAEIIVGAPDYPVSFGFGTVTGGRAFVLSGAQLVAGASPVEMYTIPGGVSAGFGWRLGAAVRACPDLNQDGTGDFMVGYPDYNAVVGGLGGAAAYSGKTGARLVSVTGATNERLGDALLGAFSDLDGDGFAEFVVAGSKGDSPSTDCGSIKCYRLWPSTPGFYCTGKQNSLGCTPTISVPSGVVSASSSAQFLIGCSNVVNNKVGILIYSHQPSGVAFQGGFLCVKAPIKRVGTQSSGGSTTGSDCSGTFRFDMHARIQSHVDPTLVVGAELFNQWWSRDPQSPSGSSLSNALRFVINP